jgi:hypothetical protein
MFGPHNLLGILVLGYVHRASGTHLTGLVRVCRLTPELPFMGLIRQRSRSLGPKGISPTSLGPVSQNLVRVCRLELPFRGWFPWGQIWSRSRSLRVKSKNLKKLICTDLHRIPHICSSLYVDSRLARSNLASTLLFTRKLSPRQGNHVLDSIALFVFVLTGTNF